MKIAKGIALFIAAAVCCGATSSVSAQHVWRHGLIKAKADAGIFMMVTTRDFAKKQGLDLQISEFKDDQIALKALIAGEVDSFEGGPQGVFTADSKGGDVRILGCHWVVVPHGIYAKSDIKTVADLKGKQIAVSAPNSMPDTLARAALEKYGVNPSDVKLAALGGDNDRYKALVSGVVQAAVVSNEYEPEAPKDVHLLVAGRDAVPKLLRVCMMSSAKILAAKGDDAARFLAAEMNALHFALTHRAETVALTAQIIKTKADDPRPGFVYDDAVKHHAVDPTLPLPMDKFAWVQDQLVKAGKITTPLDIKSVIAPEIREKAIKMSGS